MKKIILAACLVSGVGIAGGVSAYAEESGNAFGQRAQECAKANGAPSLGSGLQFNRRMFGGGNNAGGVRAALENPAYNC